MYWPVVRYMYILNNCFWLLNKVGNGLLRLGQLSGFCACICERYFISGCCEIETQVVFCVASCYVLKESLNLH